MDLKELKKLFDVLDSYIMTIDKEYNIQYCNAKMSQISGKKPNEVIGKKCYNAIHGYNNPCPKCPINESFEGQEVQVKDIVTYTGQRLFVRNNFTKLDNNTILSSLVDITDIEKEKRSFNHLHKQAKANLYRLSNEKNQADKEINFFVNALDSLATGLLIVDDEYNIQIINKNLKETAGLGVNGYNNIKCYNVYGYDKPCKDCPLTTSNTRALRQLHDKHLTINFSRYDKYIVESLRDTTREIKLIDDIKESQDEIKEKQRQMSILNADLLRMNEKLKAVQALIDEELTQVGQIQKSLLPEKLPEIEGFDFGALYIPAEQSGGDYYDCISMSNNFWGFLVADVSGHGTPAAVIMAITRAIMRSYTYDIISAADALTLVNDILCDNIHTKDFVTMFYAVFNPRKNSFSIASAGHNPVLFFDASDFIVKKITASGMFLGTFEGLTYEEKSCPIDEGDIFFMYTDGLVEAMNKEREQYGYDRLVSKIMMFSEYDPDYIVKEVMEDVKDFTEGHPFEDDITILVIKRNKKTKKRKKD